MGLAKTGIDFLEEITYDIVRPLHSCGSVADPEGLGGSLEPPLSPPPPPFLIIL